jgi:uncharacterized membrane protein
MARTGVMTPARMEAFTDGVVAIIITIMVLELPVPKAATPAALIEVAPIFLAYALSYVNVGLYWANHHHLLHMTERIDGRVLWANLFLLFWLSLVPLIIRWLDEAGFAPLPTAAYGVVLGMAAVGYTLTQNMIIARNGGRDSALAQALGRDVKGKLSLVVYPVAVILAFIEPWLAIALYVAVCLGWLVPDRRLERRMQDAGSDPVQ